MIVIFIYIFLIYCQSRGFDHVLHLQGSYTLKMRMYDGKKHELTCITFGFDIGFGSSVADS